MFIPGTDTGHTQVLRAFTLFAVMHIQQKHVALFVIQPACVLSLRFMCNHLAEQRDRFPKPLAVVHIQEKLLLGLLFRTAPPACVLSVSFIRDHFTTEMMLGFASLLLDCCCAYPQGKVVLFVVQGLSLKIHL